MKKDKKGTGYFFWEKEDCLYLETVHIEKVACPLFLRSDVAIFKKDEKRDEHREVNEYAF